jgi:hypothetical protein
MHYWRTTADITDLRVEVERLRDELADYRRLADPEAYRQAYADHPTESPVCGYQGCRLTLAEHHRLAYGFMAENKALRRDAGGA